MFGKKRYQETEYDEAFEAVAPQEEEAHEEMPMQQPEQPIMQAPVEPQPVEPTLWDSIITKIHSTYAKLKDASLQCEDLLDDPAKANLGDYMPINQNVLSYVGYIRGLLEILNESNYVTGNIEEMSSDQKVIARFTSEFESLVDLLAQNDKHVQNAFKSTAKGADVTTTVSGKVALERLNELGYQPLHRDIASRIGYMDALLEILTDSLTTVPNFAEDFNQ